MGAYTDTLDAIGGLTDRAAGGLQSVGSKALPYLKRGAIAALQALPAAYASGKHGMPVGMQMLERQQDRQMQQAMLQRRQTLLASFQQARLDPRNPQDMQRAFAAAMAAGDLELAESLGQASSMVRPKQGRVVERPDGTYMVTQGIDGTVSAQRVEGVPGTAEGPNYDAAKFLTQRYEKVGGEAYETIRSAFQRIDAAYKDYLTTGNPQAYQTLGVGLQKILDPNSVVRESEFARTEAFQGLEGRYETTKEKFRSGSVSPTLMRQIYDQARVLALGASKTQSERFGSLMSMAGEQGAMPLIEGLYADPRTFEVEFPRVTDRDPRTPGSEPTQGQQPGVTPGRVPFRGR